MAFLVETGTGLVAGVGDVLSYADVDRYLAHHQNVGENGDDLTAVAVAVIQRHLVNATRFLDQLKWNGRPKHEDGQRRTAFPRQQLVVGISNYWPRGQLLPDNEVPWVVVDACCVLAEIERSTGESLGRPRDLSKVVSRKSIGGAISKTFADAKAPRRYPDALALVAGLHRTGGPGRLIVV